jgi:hypothetical protein
MINTFDIAAYERLDRAFAEAGQTIRRFAAAIERSNIIVSYQLKIAFADSPKESRYWTRELARFMRKPSLIHKGRKNAKH